MPRWVVVQPVKLEELQETAKKAKTWRKRLAASTDIWKSKLKVKKFFRILIMDEGPCLPDIGLDKLIGLDALAALGDEEDGGLIANYPGWRVELPGDLLVKIAPAMLVVCQVLPMIAHFATGVSLALPSVGLGGEVERELEAIGSAFGSMLEEGEIAGISTAAILKKMESQGKVGLRLRPSVALVPCPQPPSNPLRDILILIVSLFSLLCAYRAGDLERRRQIGRPGEAWQRGRVAERGQRTSSSVHSHREHAEEVFRRQVGKDAGQRARGH